MQEDYTLHRITKYFYLKNKTVVETFQLVTGTSAYS